MRFVQLSQNKFIDTSKVTSFTIHEATGEYEGGISLILDMDNGSKISHVFDSYDQVVQFVESYL